MRGFLAIPIPKDIRVEISNKIALLKKSYPKLKWVIEDNYHLTLAFLGEISQEQFSELDKSLATINFSKEFTLRFTIFGAFPAISKMRVFWLGFTLPAELTTLHDAIQEKALERKLIDGKTVFKPHLTLARSKEGLSLDGVQLPEINIPSFTVQEYNFYKSDLKSSGPVYTLVKKYLLT